jgi:DNA primase
MAMLGLPVWVSAGATNLAALEFPPGVRSIVIGADNDATGHRQADWPAGLCRTRPCRAHPLPPRGLQGFQRRMEGVRHGLAA